MPTRRTRGAPFASRYEDELPGAKRKSGFEAHIGSGKAPLFLGLHRACMRRRGRGDLTGRGRAGTFLACLWRPGVRGRRSLYLTPILSCSWIAVGGCCPSAHGAECRTCRVFRDVDLQAFLSWLPGFLAGAMVINVGELNPCLLSVGMRGAGAPIIVRFRQARPGEIPLGPWACYPGSRCSHRA